MDNHSETRGGYSPSFLRPMEEKEKSALRPVNILNYQAIQILQNANLAAAAAKIDEEDNGDENLIAAKNHRHRRYTTAHLLATVESMPNQDSPVQVRSRQTVYMYTPMRHMHQLLVKKNAGEVSLEQFDQKRQLHSSDGYFAAQKHSLPRNNKVPEFDNSGNMATRSPQLCLGTSPTVHALAHNLTPPPRVNLQMKPVMPISMQQYQFGKLGWSPTLYTFPQERAIYQSYPIKGRYQCSLKQWERRIKGVRTNKERYLRREPLLELPL
ncbi:hypothetical protein F5051DRAFT_434474 [Lentinula edodes]|nr:hypothetical protein F5051DRAFT_434474 [Lentinula edodes]